MGKSADYPCESSFPLYLNLLMTLYDETIKADGDFCDQMKMGRSRKIHASCKFAYAHNHVCDSVLV